MHGVRQNGAALGLAVSLLFLSCLPSAATQIDRRSPRELAGEATLVVRGQVKSQRSFWNAAHTRILTEIEIEVRQSFKGSPASRIRVLQAGGVADGVRMTVHGVPSWRPGEDVLLYLEPSLGDRFRVAGLSQGKFGLQRDPRSGELFATRPFLGTTVSGSSDSAIRLPLRSLLRASGLRVQEVR